MRSIAARESNMTIDAEGLDFRQLNEYVKSADSCEIENCLGQRFIAAGTDGKIVTIRGVAGNALGAYLAGGKITVYGNAQDAAGDTMNGGEIVVCGSAGDAAGYAMRGGEIYVKGNAGYRAGIHMKAYESKKPVLVVGGRAGSFLGEYQAGGLIIVLGLNTDGKPVVGNFPCTGMHGGKMFLRGGADGIKFPAQVTLNEATEADLDEIAPYVKKYCEYFGADFVKLISDKFAVVTPDSKNPYKQMYVAN